MSGGSWDTCCAALVGAVGQVPPIRLGLYLAEEARKTEERKKAARLLKMRGWVREYSGMHLDPPVDCLDERMVRAVDGYTAWLELDDEKRQQWVRERRRRKVGGWQKDWRLVHKDDPDFQMRNALRKRLSCKKSARTFDLIGCSVDELWGHLGASFRPGMTRKNYGKVWHVDHIRPCASFNLADPAQQRECFHWKNLQPLFGPENLAKGSLYYRGRPCATRWDAQTAKRVPCGVVPVITAAKSAN